ncbi:hypothetical protein QZH41_007477 [Actinostola sp. cb2023]|nr:hypothetical protein QZH41_007477 [Actinostola sp. cb2023]
MKADKLHSVLEIKRAQDSNLKDKLTTYLASLNESERERLGHQEEDFIVKCVWMGVVCEEKLHHFFSPWYGNCFTFNSNEKKRTYVASSLGSSNVAPLSLTLNVESYEYIGLLSPSVGVTVQVHRRDVKPFPKDLGVTISPGIATNVAFVKKVTVRLPEPYNQDGCKNADTKVMYKNKSYSVHACMKTCLLKKCLSQCQCIPPEFYQHPYCDLFNSSHRYRMNTSIALVLVLTVIQSLLAAPVSEYTTDDCPPGIWVCKKDKIEAPKPIDSDDACPPGIWTCKKKRENIVKPEDLSINEDDDCPPGIWTCRKKRSAINPAKKGLDILKRWIKEKEREAKMLMNSKKRQPYEQSKRSYDCPPGIWVC